MKKKKIVVFGATGTLGIYLIDFLAGNLNDEWLIVAAGRKDIKFFDHKYPGKVTYRKVNIDNWETFDSLPDKNVYGVVHLAGVLPAYMRGYDPRAYVQSNVMGTLNVLEYMRVNNADRIIFPQTISDYNGYFNERIELMDDMPRRIPLSGDHSVYAITKCAAEDIIWNYRAEYGIGAFVMRLPNIYCYMPEAKTLYHDGVPAVSSYRYMIQRALDGQDLEVWGDPEKGMDLIYVKDFCQMVFKALFVDKTKSGTFNVGTGVLTSLNEMVDILIDVFCDKDNRSNKIIRPDKHDCVNYFMNVDKACKDLGYKVEYTPLKLFKDYKKEMEENRFAEFFIEYYGTSKSYDK